MLSPMAKLLFNPSDYPEVTFDDVCLIPNNPVEERVLEVASPEDVSRLRTASDLADDSPERFAEYRRILLDLADAYGCGAPISRDEVDLKPNGSLANTPIMVANMNAVSGKRMAEAIARVGGLATIPQDKTNKEVEEIIGYLRSRHPVYETPVKVTPHTKVHEFRRLLKKRSHGTAIVQNGDEDLRGVIGEGDVPQGWNEDSTIEQFVRGSDIVTADEGIEPLDALILMDKSHVNYLPIKGKDGGVIGVLPKIDAAMRLRYLPNIDTVHGGLRAAFTVGALNKNPLDRVKLLLDLGVYDIQFDTAHSDQGTQVYRNIEKTIDIAIKEGIDPTRLNIIVGNMVTREAVRSSITAGAKYVKGGIGPGNACTTRMMTGVGRPQLSMILECADEAHKRGGYLIADGGVRHPRDVSIALAAEADYVMVGSLFAGTYESPPDIQHDKETGYYKFNHGMASSRMSVFRTIGRARRSAMEIFREGVGHRSEGISEQKVRLQPGRESVALLHNYLMDGATSGITYAGARSVREYPRRAVMAIQTTGGYREGEAKSSL